VGSCPRVLRVSFSCFPGYSLVLDTRGRLGGKVGSSSEEFENIKGGQFTRVVLDKGPLTCYCVLWCISGLPLQL